jgi:hypothetical protein
MGVIDDKEAECAQLQRHGVLVQPSGPLDFLDPWGNHVQVVDTTIFSSRKLQPSSAA